MSPRPLRLDSIVLLLAVLLVYLVGLAGSGFISQDEPRYASIGREMARSGDWITPRLDGQPWFEKPPLLYWMIGVGHRLHLSDEWAARMPVAIVSVVFLAYFFRRVADEFSEHIALASAAILATCAGWVAYSFGALTDLPMSAALGASMLILVFDKRPHRGYTAGVLLGLAILAKGFVPLVLIAPAWLIAERKRLRSAVACIVVAAPWFIWCWARNGPVFWQEFFWKHHIARFLESSVGHPQPFWFFIPVLLAGLFPWTPLALLLLRPKTYADARTRFLALWLVYGLIFFSVARNKLPGYVLPLLPALAILLALALDKSPAAHWWLAASGALLVAVPAIARLLPEAMLIGLSHVRPSFVPGLPFALFAMAAWWLAWRERGSIGRSAAILCVAVGAMIGVVYIKARALPELDRRVSVRGFWRAHPETGACLDWVRRDWVYGLNYYANRVLPSCEDSPPATPRITGRDDRLALLPSVPH